MCQGKVIRELADDVVCRSARREAAVGGSSAGKGAFKSGLTSALVNRIRHGAEGEISGKSAEGRIWGSFIGFGEMRRDYKGSTIHLGGHGRGERCEGSQGRSAGRKKVSKLRRIAGQRRSNEDRLPEAELSGVVGSLVLG